MSPKSSTPNGNGTHSLTLKFTEPEDIALYQKLEEGAKLERRSLAIYTLLALHTSFKLITESEK